MIEMPVIAYMVILTLMFSAGYMMGKSHIQRKVAEEWLKINKAWTNISQDYTHLEEEWRRLGRK